jgi:type VI secretion system protein VasD
MKIGDNPWLLLATMAVAACGGLMSPKPTVVELTVTAAPGINPVPPNDRPSPVVVRLYELASANRFLNADFYQLDRDAPAALGKDLAAQDEFVMMPGGSESLVRELAPSTRYLGIVAVYRSIDRATWRALAQVQPNRTTPLEANLERLTVTLVAAGTGS